MSRTSLVQTEWPVEFKRDLNINTRELSRVALLFHWWASNLREPSNWSIKSRYKKSSSEILRVQDRFSNRFQQRCTLPDPCHNPACHSNPTDMISINGPTITTRPSSPRRGRWTFSTYASWSAWRERGYRKKTFDSGVKRESEEERYWTNFLTKVRCNPQE